MAPKIIGWTVQNRRNRSHLVGEHVVIVGTREARPASVRYLLCGSQGDYRGLSDNPDTIMCARCMGVAFRLARCEELPEMELRKLSRD